MFTLPHYLKPVSGVQKVENGKKWRGEGTRQKKGRGTSLPPPPHYLFFPTTYLWAVPTIWMPGTGCTILLYTYLNWTKNQTKYKHDLKSNFTIVNDHLIWVLYLALCCSFSPPTVLKMSWKSLTADWHANNFLPAKLQQKIVNYFKST